MLDKHESIEDPLETMSEKYFSALRNSLYDYEMNKNFGSQKIVYSAMHGVGAEYIDRAFEATGFQPVVQVVEQKGEEDPS